MDQRGGDCRINATAKAKHNAPVCNLRLDSGYALVNDRSRRPIGGTAANIQHKVTQNGATKRRMGDFGVEGNRVITATLIAHRSILCITGLGKWLPPIRQ